MFENRSELVNGANFGCPTWVQWEAMQWAHVKDQMKGDWIAR